MKILYSTRPTEPICESHPSTQWRGDLLPDQLPARPAAVHHPVYFDIYALIPAVAAPDMD